MKKVLLITLAIILAGFVALYLEDDYNRFIRNLYSWSSIGRIEFHGKDFRIFPGLLFTGSVAILFIAITIENLSSPLRVIIKRILVSLIIIIVSAVFFSTIDAWLKIIQCTACDDGILSLRKNEIKYSMIFSFSVLVTLLIMLIRTLRYNKRRNIDK